MSKAFTRESDDAPDVPLVARPASALPPGTRNYLTTDGAERLRAELTNLSQNERPSLVAAGDDSEAKRRLQVLDQRIRQLQASLQSATIVPPPVGTEDQVKFGATVTVRESNGEETVYRIVGVDETDIDRGWVSWISPIAKALLNARLGQRVRFRFPTGETELEIIKISYETA